MRLLSALWSCLLGIVGCQGHATFDLSTDAHRETVVHTSERGVAVIFSRDRLPKPLRYRPFLVHLSRSLHEARQSDGSARRD